MIMIISGIIFAVIVFLYNDSDRWIDLAIAILGGLLVGLFVTLIFDLIVLGFGNWESKYEDSIVIENTDNTTIIQSNEEVIITDGKKVFSYEIDLVDIQIVDTDSPLTIKKEIKYLTNKVLNWLYVPKNPTIEHYYIFAPGDIKFAYP